MRHFRSFGRRSFFSLASVAKFPIRLLVGGTAAVVGYTSYKITETTDWLKEKAGTLRWLRDAAAASMPTRVEASAQTEQPLEPADPLPFDSFIRRMVAVRSLLRVANTGEQIDLPAIVVIGSQSAGKSSVLEALVGREFLPKGSNMVTRRPLEITLVNDQNEAQPVAILPQHPSLGEVRDFAKLGRYLKDLMASVPDSVCVSAQPIEVVIRGRSVPDLSLVDLPGYIAVPSKSQPPLLRQQIRDLCDAYLRRQPNNLILAVSPADADLATSESLKVSRLIDPSGVRTIGVITKIDLVDHSTVRTLVGNEAYPLARGYVGVACRPNEEQDAFVNKTPELRGDVSFGIAALRKRLLQALEEGMSDAFEAAFDRVASDLEQVAYRFTVLYNDAPISAESYVSSIATQIREGVGTIASRYTKPVVRDRIRSALQDQLATTLSETIWNDVKFEDRNRLLLDATASFLKCGVGKISANCISSDLQKEVSAFLSKPPFSFHRQTISRVTSEVISKIGDRLSAASSQIEGFVKPLKFQTAEFTPSEWRAARTQAVHFLRSQITSMAEQHCALLERYGGSAVYEAVAASATEDATEEQKRICRDAVALHRHRRVLEDRLKALCSDPLCKEPASVQNAKRRSRERILVWLGIAIPQTLSSTLAYDLQPDGQLLIQRDPCCSHCPEVFLHLLLERLVAIAQDLVHVEISAQQQPSFSHSDTAITESIASSFTRLIQDPERLDSFVRENGNAYEHLQLVRRKEALEKAKEQLLYLKSMRSTKAAALNEAN